MGGRAGGGASGGMGSRSRGGGVAYFKETEKAVQLGMTVTATYSGTSYKTGEWEDVTKTFEQKVWFPKSQMKDGKPTEWIAKQKGKEIMKSYHHHSPYKGFSPTGTFKITDANGKTVETAK
jgi:hypothetical protein